MLHACAQQCGQWEQPPVTSQCKEATAPSMPCSVLLAYTTRHLQRASTCVAGICDNLSGTHVRTHGKQQAMPTAGSHANVVSPRASVLAPTCFAGVCYGPCIVQLDLQLGQGARPGSVSRAEELTLPLTAAVRVACKGPLGLLVQLLCATCRSVSCLASIPLARPAV